MSTNLLPLYNQRGSPVLGFRRWPFRIREKYLILVGGILLVCICYSGFIFLPEVSPGGSASIRRRVEEALQKPAQLVIPPRWYKQNGTFRHIPLDHAKEGEEADPHRKQDEARLRHKIDSAQIPPPIPKQVQEEIVVLDDNAKRRDAVKQMLIFAWDGYAKYAWGANELRPVSNKGHSASIFGQSSLGATIVDALDTLHLMGLTERFQSGRKWIELSFDIKNIRGDLSVFETNIRFLGGLLSCYALTKDELFKRKATEVADVLLPAFNTPTGIPLALVNVRTKAAKNWGWASGGSSILSEFGSLNLEFEYLSVITGNPIYAEKTKRIREVLNSLEKPSGLYPNYLNPKTGKWGSRHTSMGALGDSFYEYLLKSWIITGKRDEEGRRMYLAAIEEFERQLLQRSAKGLLYFAELRGTRLDHKMDHLACFSGGMMALHAANEANETVQEHYMGLAKEIGMTCHESYVRTETGLGPESFRFTKDFEAKTINDREKYYILRPEVIETWFYLWRLTKEQKYRDWAWAAVEALEKYCKTSSGYSGIRNVYTTTPAKDDVQQSFFLAETLKYLFLIFSDEDVLPLDRWVFNTEAHPLPVRLNDRDHAPPAAPSKAPTNL